MRDDETGRPGFKALMMELIGKAAEIVVRGLWKQRLKLNGPLTAAA